MLGEESDLWFMEFEACLDKDQAALGEENRGNTRQLTDSCLKPDLVLALFLVPEEQVTLGMPVEGAVGFPALLREFFPGLESGQEATVTEPNEMNGQSLVASHVPRRTSTFDGWYRRTFCHELG